MPECNRFPRGAPPPATRRTYSMSNAYRYIISACLCGEPCRYDGTGRAIPELVSLVAGGLAVAFCPEVAGGLPTPRPPCEVLAGRVIFRDGKDCSQAFAEGARAALRLAREHGIRAAILKERSPSCGVRVVYDGTFSGRLVPGMGLTAALLAADGITLYSEEDLPGELLAGLVPHA